MKIKQLVSLLVAAALSASASLSVAQTQPGTILGVSAPTAVAIGVVGATIIAAAVDDDSNDNGNDDPMEPMEPMEPTDTTGTTDTTTTGT